MCLLLPLPRRLQFSQRNIYFKLLCEIAFPALLFPEAVECLPFCLKRVTDGMDFEADDGVRINTAVWTLVGVSGLFLGLRLGCKLRRAGSLWWDDALLTVSWVFLLVSIVFNTLTVQRGFGKHVYDIPTEALSDITYLGQWSGTFSILAAVLSKTSFAATLMRFMDGAWKVLLWIIIVTMNIAMGLNALLAWLQCTPIAKGWHPEMPGQCWPPEVYAHFGMFAAGEYPATSQTSSNGGRTWSYGTNST